LRHADELNAFKGVRDAATAFATATIGGEENGDEMRMG